MNKATQQAPMVGVEETYATIARVESKIDGSVRAVPLVVTSVLQDPRYAVQFQFKVDDEFRHEGCKVHVLFNSAEALETGADPVEIVTPIELVFDDDTGPAILEAFRTGEGWLSLMAMVEQHRRDQGPTPGCGCLACQTLRGGLN